MKFKPILVVSALFVGLCLSACTLSHTSSSAAPDSTPSASTSEAATSVPASSAAPVSSADATSSKTTTSSIPVTYTYTLDVTAETVKKTYRLVDRFDPTGIVVMKIGSNSTETKVDVSKLAYEMDVAGGKINLTMPDKTVQFFAVTFDVKAADNTITGTLGDKPVTMVVTALDSMTVTAGDKSCVVKIALSGKGLATIAIVEKTSGDDDVSALLPKSFGISETAGVLSIASSRYFTSGTKANSYSQDANTYFVFGSDTSYVIAFWTFTYQEVTSPQEMRCSYTLSGDLANDVSITLTDLIEETNGQWQWCNNKTFVLTECGVADLPFAPTLH